MRLMVCLLLGLFASVSAKVLVLGSGGLVGTSMIKWLAANGYDALEVKNRHHIDLRVPGALDQFDNAGVTFVMFLACEVGGSKFITSNSQDIQSQILENNILIYQTVFSWLVKHKIPFIFTSSYLEGQAGSYGLIKRVGEYWMQNIGVGKVVRLWNVYGFEPLGVKSHVVPDWVNGCLKENQITSNSDGTEERQFLHSDDCASALGTLMTHYEEAPFVTDLSGAVWSKMKDVGTMIASLATSPCTTFFPDVKAVKRDHRSPDTSTLLYKKWAPSISFENGVSSLYRLYSQSNRKGQVKEEL